MNNSKNIMKSITRILFILVVFTGFSSTVVWSKAYGPSSIANLKLGMTKSEIRSFKKGSPIYLTQDFECREDLTFWCDTKFMTPFTSQELEGYVLFADSGKASDITISFGKNKYVYERVLKLIEDKYGLPQIDNQMEKEMCAYKTGNQFELDDGVVYKNWKKDNGDIYIVLSGYRHSIPLCPISLSYGSPSTTVKYGISLRRALKEEKTITNLF